MDDATATDIADTVVGIYGRQLRGFVPAEGALDEEDLVHTHRMPPAAVAYEPLFEILLRCGGAFEGAAYDKTGWLYSFSLNGRSCRLRWTKAGLRLDLFRGEGEDRDDAADAEAIGKRLLSAAKSFYVRAVEPRLTPSIADGRAVVINQFPRYRGMVDFHRKSILDAGEETAEPAVEPSGNQHADAVLRAVALALSPTFHDRDQAYRATALIAGYFSWVQHLLVTLTAFSPAAADDGFSLAELLRGQWADQFDLAYPHPHDDATKQLKDDIQDLAREYRNPLLHGGGGRFEDGVLAEWVPGHQIMAVNPDALTEQYMLHEPALTKAQVSDLLNRIDRIDAGFQRHPFFAWAAEGLPADFRREAVNRALAERNNGTAAAFTAAASDALDDGINWNGVR